MKHNFVGDKVKKQALHEYLDGGSSIKQIAAKYGISDSTMYLYKKKNSNYVKEYQLKMISEKKNTDTTMKHKKEVDTFLDSVLSDYHSTQQQPEPEPKKRMTKKEKRLIMETISEKNEKVNNERILHPKVIDTKFERHGKKKLKIVSYEEEITKLLNAAQLIN
jgi:transposase-like protein